MIAGPSERRVTTAIGDKRAKMGRVGGYLPFWHRPDKERLISIAGSLTQKDNEASITKGRPMPGIFVVDLD